MRTSPRSYLPLTPLSFQVLLALADRDLHGYGILKETEERTGEPMKASTGTLYLALQRLEQQELIEKAPQADRPPGDSRRRYYRLTGLGVEVAELEAARLERLVGVAYEKRLLGAAFGGRGK